MKMNARKVLALLLCLAMCLGMLPAGIVSAAEPEQVAIPIYEDTSYSFAERAADLVARMTLKQKGSQLVEGSAAIPASQLGGGALKTPATKDIARYSWWAEALHGLLRDNLSPQSEGTKDNVSYAQSLTMGSTWNPDLYYEGAIAIADECRERSVKNSLGNALNINFYSPTVNMQRDPRWGRNEESYSEDVYLNSIMGAAFVNGMEGKDREGNVIDPSGYLKTHTTIKHYTANNTEAIRTNGGATSDLRALREYYTAPYRNVIRMADVSSVMTAYSSFNGEPCSYSSYLMDTLLRQTFGFSGYITSDCDSAKTISNLNYTNPRTGAKLTGVEQMAGALAHGEDLECNSGISASVSDYNAQSQGMADAGVQTDKGTFTENSIDVSVHRLMTARIATGEFDENNPYTIAANERMADQKANGTNNYTPERIAIVDREVEEGVVMLKNDGILPLSIPASGAYNVVIVGSWQTDMYLGLYSSEQRHAEDDKWRINIQKGITNAIKEVNPDATFTYITSTSLTAANEEAIRAADAAIVVVGTGNSYSAEGRDRSSTALPNNQATLISNVGKLNANTVAVMETCGPMEVKTFENDVKAILWSSFGGIRKGVGFGKVLTGAVNPSGHLTATWYKNDSDIPGIRDYNMYATNGSNGRTYMYYVGANEPSYVFGYGLSYTTFAYSNLKIDKTSYDANGTVKATFDVKNTGKVAGKEVTQLYIAQPNAPKELNRPIRRLEGFQKVELQPGETKTITMEVKIPDLAFYDEAADCYKVDTGAYQVQVGEDSAHANLTADFTVSGEMDEYPVLLTVKANQVGDDALGIEERVIFDKGAIINPQLTVAMNNEKLYGYIIKEQTSIIKSLESCPLPEGMTFEYESNRPSVASVTNGVIKAVAPGVATITVTGELDGHVVTDDFVVYVMVNSKLDGIEVNGEPIAKFAADKYSYKMTLEADAKMPVVTAQGKAGMDVKVEMPASLPGIATITSTDPESGVADVYTIEFKVKSANSNYMLADEIEVGKSYVIVYNDAYAMTFGDSITSTEVEVRDDMIVSDVTDEMLWTFNEGSCSRAGEYTTGYFLTCGDSGVLSRSSSRLTTTAYTLDSIVGNSGDYYAYWIMQDLDIDGNKGMFLLSSYGSNRYVLQGSETGFTPKSGSNLDSLLSGAPLKLYEYVAGLPNIDFTNPADASKFDVVNESTAAIEEGKGLTLTATRPAFETCNGQNSGSQATTPEDVVVVPVSGDWTATLEFDFSTGSAANGYYQFFGFYASEGEDFQNLAGIRGGDGALQNFLRTDGNITADSAELNSAPGLASAGTYWFQIVKEGDTYTCLRSADGDEFTEMFAYEATGIEADSIVIDAYTGMTEGYKFTLKSLNFEGGITKKEKPEVASITINGEDFGFNKDTKIYNFEVAKDSTAVPVIEATAANKSTQITIQQLDGPFGTAYVTANVDKKAITYSLSFNYGPQDDYFADGDMSDNWTILHEVKDPTPERPWTYYRFEEGTGLVMPTQKGSIYMAKQADPQGPWTNMFTMPAQGNWEVIIKSFYPQLPKDIYQQTQVLAWQDEDHYIRINCQYNAQQNLRVEPANEVGSGTFNILDVTYANPNPDNTATLYYKINKNGTTYTVSYSTDCKTWVAGGSVSGLDYVDPKIGIFCTQDDGNDNYIELAFEYVAVTSLNGVEQKNGIEVLNWAAQNVADYIAEGLPTETAGKLTYKAPHGYEVAFVSSNPAVIAENGTVTPAAADTKVQVAVKVTEGDISVTSEPVTITVKGTTAPHEHSYVKTVTAPTCTEKGFTTYTCSKCGDEYKADETPALGHAWDAGVITKPATATETGIRTYTCSRCGEIKTEVIPATGDNSYEDILKAAQKEAEAAQAAAEAAEKQAEQDKKAAEEAQAAADKAQAEADAAQKAADAAAADATADQAAVEAAQKAAADAQAAADKAQAAAEAAKNALDDSKAKAEEQIKAADLSAAKFKALADLINAAAELDLASFDDFQLAAFDKLMAESIAAIQNAADVAAVNAALAAAKEALAAGFPARPVITFEDMPAEGNWAYDGIAYCVYNGYMNGVSEKLFKPAGNVTRGQLVTILYRIAGEPKVDSEVEFSDVAEGRYYSDAIDWAAKTGIVTGYPDGTFRPDAKITREQIAVILYRYAGKPDVSGNLNAFPDAENVSNYARDAMIWATSTGLINGISGKDGVILSPKTYATRAQIAALIMRNLEGAEA